MSKFMSYEEISMHLAAGLTAGRDSTCGLKIQHSTLESAQRHADTLNARPEVGRGERTRAEPYPCPWCSPGVFSGILVYDEDDDVYWHVGREMTEAERKFHAPK